MLGHWDFFSHLWSCVSCAKRKIQPRLTGNRHYKRVCLVLRLLGRVGPNKVFWVGLNPSRVWLEGHGCPTFSVWLEINWTWVSHVSLSFLLLPWVILLCSSTPIRPLFVPARPPLLVPVRLPLLVDRAAASLSTSSRLGVALHQGCTWPPLQGLCVATTVERGWDSAWHAAGSPVSARTQKQEVGSIDFSGLEESNEPGSIKNLLT